MATTTVNQNKEFAELTAFQRDMLGVIGRSDGEYGLAIKRDMEALYGEEVNHGRLYPNLDELVEGGYVEKSEIDKRTNRYELTVEGRAVVRRFADWYGTCLGEDDDESN